MKHSPAFAVGAAMLLAAGAPLAQDAKAPMPNTTLATPSSGSSVDVSSQMDEHTQMLKALHEKRVGAITPEARQIVMEMQGCTATMIQMKLGGGMMSGTKSAAAAPRN